MQRLLLFSLAMVLLWWLSLHVIFLRAYLGLARSNLPWPREAFWRSLGWFVFLACVAFVGVFGFFSNELTGGVSGIFPASMPWLNRYGVVSLVLMGGAFSALFLARYGALQRPSSRE